MPTYPRCKDCGHSKLKHSTTQKILGGRSLNGKDSAMCRDCYDFWLYGATHTRDLDRSINDIEMYHVYRPDNLEYLERKYEVAAKNKGD